MEEKIVNRESHDLGKEIHSNEMIERIEKVKREKKENENKKSD